MSSTGRRAERLGGPEDHFATPSWAVRRRLEVGDLPGGIWLEPGAGDGAIIRAVNAVRSDVRWIAVEIREEAIAVLERIQNVTVLRGDFLAESSRVLLNSSIAVVLGNPPYQDAQPFIDQARVVAPRAPVVQLLRTNFTGSEERADFMRRCAPDIAQLPNRPSFYLRLTDSIEYSWMTFHPGERRIGRFEVLASTAIEERQHDMPAVGKCAPCKGLGWFTASWEAVKKHHPLADRPCRGCLGFGKVKTGPSDVEREWGMAA
jgi:hypothetical protein